MDPQIMNQAIGVIVMFSVVIVVSIVLCIYAYIRKSKSKRTVLHTHKSEGTGIITVTHPKDQTFKKGEIIEILGTESINGIHTIFEVLNNEQFSFELVNAEDSNITVESGYVMKEGYLDQDDADRKQIPMIIRKSSSAGLESPSLGKKSSAKIAPLKDPASETLTLNTNSTDAEADDAPLLKVPAPSSSSVPEERETIIQVAPSTPAGADGTETLDRGAAATNAGEEGSQVVTVIQTGGKAEEEL